MPAELCNAIAPLYDNGNLHFLGSSVSFVEPISKRSRHAKQAVLFVELRMKLHTWQETPVKNGLIFTGVFVFLSKSTPL